MRYWQVLNKIYWENFLNFWRIVSGKRAIHYIAEAPIDESLGLHDTPFAVMDLETTGLDVMRDRVLSFGGIYMEGGRRQDNILEMMLNPEMRIPRTSQAIHGIHNSMVADKPNFANSWEHLHGFLSERVIVGHHIAFDISFLHRQAFDAGYLWKPQFYLDTGLLMAALHPEFKSQDLDEIVKFYGIYNADYERHTALGDAEIAAALFSVLLRELQEQGITTLADAMALQATRKGIINQQKHEGWYEWQ